MQRHDRSTHEQAVKERFALPAHRVASARKLPTGIGQTRRLDIALNLLQDRGTPLVRQRFTWKEMVGKPMSKLDDDAVTRIRVILMNGVETDALRYKQVLLRMNREARVPSGS